MTTISLLSVLNAAEQSDVLSGANTIDITSKVNSWIAGAPDGSTLDATMLNGTVTFTSDIFSGIHSKACELQFGKVTIRKNFNSGGFRRPSFLKLRFGGTTIRPTAPITTIPSNMSPASAMIETWVGSGTCSGNYNQSTVTVSSAVGINPGALIALIGAKVDNAIIYNLSSAISASQTSFSFTTNASGQIEGGQVYLQIDNEVVLGTYAGSTFTVLQRGALGTVAAAHANATAVYWRNTVVARVLFVSGNIVTIDRPHSQTFSATPFVAGSVQGEVSGDLEIDGEFDRATGAPNVWLCLASALSRFDRVHGNIRLRRGCHGAVLMMGCDSNHWEIERMEQSGKPAISLGATAWLFGSNFNCQIDAAFLDDGNIGVAVDNKSFGVSAHALEQPNWSCRINIGHCRNHKTPYDLAGSHNITLKIDHSLSTVGAGGIFGSYPQTTAALLSTGCLVEIGQEITSFPQDGDSNAGNIVIRKGKLLP